MTENNTQNTNLLSRAFLFLEDSEWQKANEYAEKVLDSEPKNADAYLCKLLSEFRVVRKELLPDVQAEISQSKNYANALKYADASQKQFLENCAQKAHAAVAEKARVESVQHAIKTFSETIDAYRFTQDSNRNMIRRGKSAVIMYLITYLIYILYVATIITVITLDIINNGQFYQPYLAMGLGFGFMAYLIILCIAHARVAHFLDIDYDNDRGWSVPILFGMINILALGIWGLVQTVVTCKECKALKENNVEMDRQISNLQQQIEELQK